MDNLHVIELDHTRPETAAAIHAVMMAAYQIEAALLGVASFAPLQQTPAQIAAARAAFYGIWLESDLIAVAEIESAGPARRHIGTLVVHPAYFRRGLATALLRHIFQTYPDVDFTVSTGRDNQPAMRLYAAHGFREQRRWTTRDGISMASLRLDRASAAPGA